MPFPKVVNRLNAIDKNKTKVSFDLAQDADEDEIVSSIAKLENRLRAMNDDLMDKEDSLKEMGINKEKIVLDNKVALDAAKKVAEDKAKEAEDAMCSYNKMKEEHDAMKVKNEELMNKEAVRVEEVKAADLKFRKERATNYVDKLIDQKKVVATEEMPLDKVKEYLINKATENYEDVVTQYSITPIRVSGVKPGLLKNGVKVDISLMDKVYAENRERIANKQQIIEGGVTRKLIDNSIVSA